MFIKSKKFINKLKYNFQIIFKENVDDDFEKECQDAFLKFLDSFYNILFVIFILVALGSLYFFITDVIL